VVNLPPRALDDGPATWNLDEICGVFSKIELFELLEPGTASI
jgi:hypothetical protein